MKLKCIIFFLFITCWSCIGIISFNDIDNKQFQDYTTKVKYFQLPSEVKKAALLKKRGGEYYYIHIIDDSTFIEKKVKYISRAISSSEINSRNLLKDGAHFEINDKRFFDSRDRLKFLFKKKLYYTNHYHSLHFMPKNQQEAKVITTLLDSVDFYCLDLEKIIRD